MQPLLIIGAEVVNTLTGFKFIGEKIHEYEDFGSVVKNFVIGYEESYGYLVGTHARDKDAVVQYFLILSEAALCYKLKGMSLYDALMEIYAQFGYYKEALKSITLKGIDGVEKIAEIMKSFRNDDIDSIAGVKVDRKLDYKEGIDGLPKADVLKFVLEDKSWIAIRPSGTEPKIKFYFGVCGDNEVESDKKIEKFMEYIEARL